MKNLFTILSVVALSITASAQTHVFTYANGPKNPVGIDTMYGTVLSSIPPVPDGQLHTWDLSAAVLASYRYYSAFSVASGFTGATHSNLAYIEFGTNQKYESQLMMSIDTSGIKTIGERLARQAFSLNTANPTDSVVVLAQDVNYSAPLVRMPYPCTMSTKWNSTARAVYKLSITYTPTPLPQVKNAPAERVTITTSTNEVVGWGHMKIKRLDGRPSGQRPVLEVKNTITTVDSFYINGAPAPAQLLAAAGIQQGETNTVYQKTFYREYEMLPMCNITYKNANFNDADKEDVNMHAQRLPFPDGIDDVSAPVAEIYPNPNNGQFTVSVPDANNGKWSYTVTDVVGKNVQTGVLSINNANKKVVVSLAESVVPGTYIVNIEHDGNAVSGKKIVVQ